MKFGTRIRMVFGMRLEFGWGFGRGWNRNWDVD